jgi:hypothetical protein
MNSSLNTRLAALALSAWLLGCSGSGPAGPAGAGDGDGGDSADAAPTVTFTTLFTAVLKPACGSCHSPSGADGFLDLSTQAGAFNALMASPSGPSCASSAIRSRVIPGNAAASLVYEKVSESRPACGAQMPLGGAALSAASLQLLMTWIEEGAPND